MSLPSAVEAITISKPGGLEVLEKTTLPFPEQRLGEMLVKVRVHLSCILGVNMMEG